MGELPGYFKLRLHLFDEADVLGMVAMDVLERELASGSGIAHAVDGASRTFSQALQNIVVEEFGGHELTSTFSAWPIECAYSAGGNPDAFASFVPADDDG